VKARAGCAVLASLIVALSGHVSGQQRAGGPPAPPPTARAAAPIDVTGYWTAVVTEDWRYRMVTPAKGDYQAVPMTPAAIKLADAWDPKADEAAGLQCRSYGAPAIMHTATRLHITWQDDRTLRVDTDYGTQTRLFRFKAPGAAPASSRRSWQGDSVAQWEAGARGRGGAAVGGALRVTTGNLLNGYLRKNGVPYSQNARLTEYFDVTPLPGNGQLLVVTAAVEDPMYLDRRFVVSSHFKKEADGAKWDPTPCSSTW
jgi:hypothetical protein